MDCFHLLPVNQHQISNVDDKPGRLTKDENRILAVDGIGKQDNRAHQREVPKIEGDIALFFLFRSDPLDDKPQGEDDLSEKAKKYPPVDIVHESIQWYTA